MKKKILITGQNSYIGRQLKKWLNNYPDKYFIETVSLRSDSWRNKKFTEIDVIFHAVGIAHQKETHKNVDNYYKINRDLAFEVAKKAKKEGVKQFIFVSSMSVYGVEQGIIDENTPVVPKSHYGKSKLEGEKLIKSLEDKTFKVAIIRPPMIYGKECKGNYVKLSQIANNIPVFPNIKNQRSMIYIINFCEFVRFLINDCAYGLFFPQDKEYVCTSEMVRLIAMFHGKKIYFTKLFNPILRNLKINLLIKVFGNLKYSKSMSAYRNINYSLVSFEDSIKATEDFE